MQVEIRDSQVTGQNRLQIHTNQYRSIMYFQQKLTLNLHNNDLGWETPTHNAT